MAQTAPEQPEPQRILERDQSTPVEGYLLGELHGVLDPTGRENASLLRFRFHLLSLQRHRRLTFVNISIHFADAQGRTDSDPGVCSFAPEGRFMAQIAVHNETRVVKGGWLLRFLGVLRFFVLPDVLGPDFPWERKVTVEREFGIMLNGAARIQDRNFGATNAVTWSISENALRKEGLSLVFETAVLLKRVNDDPFLAKIQVDTETSIDLTILRMIETFFRRGSGTTDNLIPFNPGAPVRRKLVGDPDRLSEIDLEELRSVAISNGIPDRNKDLADVENGDEKGLIQVVEGLKKEQKLFDFSRGFHPEVWYKFKRFETLSLLNLYNYQDKLVILDKKINEKEGDLSEEDSATLAKLLREYHDAMKLFKEISQLGRPSLADRRATANILKDKLKEPHYLSAGDALGMVDLTPEALGVPADPIRLFLQTKVPPILHTHGSNHQGQVASQLLPVAKMFEKELFPPGKPPIPQSPVPILPVVDKLARLLVALVGGGFLLGPMYAMTYIRVQKYQLMTAVLFVLSFAILVAFGTKASNQEFLGATAAYATVLVIFINQNPGGR